MSKEKDLKSKAKDLMKDVKDSTKEFTKKDIESGKGMGILSYILPFIPYFAEKNNKYVRYHAIQGMNLLIVAIAYSIVYSVLSNLITVKKSCWYIENCYRVTPWWITLPLSLIGLCITILCIIGIVNVCNGKAKELPIVNKVKIFKK